MRSERFQVFLSHNSKDKPEVEIIANQLANDPKLTVWLDKWNLLPGDPWMEAIEEALETCNVFLFFVGKNGSGPWQHEEMMLAVDRRVKAQDHQYRVIPVLLPGADRGKRGKLSKFLVRSTWVEFRESVYEEDTLAYLIQGIKGERTALVKQDNATICPFKGLAYFDVDDHSFFFGREALVEWLLNDLKVAKENKFLAIVGASGSGKSSLARAGLLAALKHGKIPDSHRWPQVIIFPGENPLENLALGLVGQSILDAGPKSIQDFIDSCIQNERALYLTSRAFTSQNPERKQFVLLVDQFEEVFTQCQDESIRKSFIDNLCYAATASLGGIIIVLTIRSDFFGKGAPYEQFSALLPKQSYLVGPMNEAELKDAILLPAQQYAFEYEPGLASKLQEDSLAEVGSLPLLQDTLRELWRRKVNGTITYETYQELGGLSGGLDKRATAFYQELPEAKQSLCKTIFLRLTQPGEGAEDTKRRVSIPELLVLKSEREDVEELLAKLSGPDIRLLTIDKDFVEISHEALIRNWQLLKSWIEQERENLLLHRRLTRAAEEWTAAEERSDYLFTGTRLAQYEEWADQEEVVLNQQEQAFLTRGIQQRGQQKKRNQFIRFGAAMILLLFSTGLLFALITSNQARKEALKNQGSSFSALALSQLQGNDKVASFEHFRLAEEAHYLNPNDFAVQNVFHNSYRNFRPNLLLSGHNGPVRGANFNCDETKILTWSDDHTARIWNIKDPQNPIILNGHYGSVVGASFSKDETKVLTWSDDHTAKIWNAKDPQNPIILNGHYGSVIGASFNQDETQVLTWSNDNTARIWSIKDPQYPIILEGHGDWIRGASFNRDETKVLTWCTDNTARIWNTKDPQNPIILMGHTDYVSGASFNEDETKVLTWSADNSARIWNTKDPQYPIILNGHNEFINGASFNQDETKVLTWSADNTARIWNTKDPQYPIILNGHSGSVNGASFNQDETKVLTWSDDSTARIWNTKDPQYPIILTGHNGSINGASFNKDGTKVLTWSADNTARIWNIRGPQNPTILMEHSSFIHGASFSKDGTKVLTWSADSTAGIWNTYDPQNPIILKGHTSWIYGASFNKDETKVLTWSYDNTARIWNTEDPQNPIILMGHKGWIYGASFNKDETKVLTWSDDNTPRIWNTKDPQNPIILEGHNGWIFGASFNKDGTRVLTWSADNTARIWNTKDPQNPIILKGHANPIGGASFNQNETKVLTWSSDNTARIWNTKDPQNPIILKGHTSPIQSASFNQNETKVLTWSSDSTARIWNTEDPQNPIILKGHNSSVRGANFNKDGTKVLTWSDDHTARIWNAKDPQNPIILEGHNDWINGTSFNKDGTKVLTWSYDNTVRIWNTKDPRNPIILNGHGGSVNGASFNNDESKVLTWSSDYTARIWDLSIDRILQDLYDTYPLEMRQPLDEELKQKYGLKGLYLQKMGE